MNEAEWLACAHPTPMRRFLEGEASARKLRLVACACCRHIWHSFADQRSRTAVEMAERLADGEITEEEAKAFLRQDWDRARPPTQIDGYSVARSALIPHPAVTRAVPALAAGYVESLGAPRDEEARFQCALVRDIFGNPFRPVAIDHTRLSSNVVDLARTIYEERELPSGSLDHTRLPILADALLDAGCDNEDLLAHCRSSGPHVRGCWVIDLLLGKS